MPLNISKDQIMSELIETLDANNLHDFIAELRIVKEVGGDLYKCYDHSNGFKTILQLAIEKEDNTAFAEELLMNDAPANFYNMQTGSCPIHDVARAASPEMLGVLFKYPANKADVNVYDCEGMTPFHILLIKLMDLADLEVLPFESRGDVQLTDEQICEMMARIMKCIIILLKQRDLRLKFNIGYSDIGPCETIGKALLKLGTMTPLQIICSFQSPNANVLSEELHNLLEEICRIILDRPGVDPNATAAQGVIAGEAAGSTPPVLLAATRGYFKVVDIFKNHHATDFMIVNKFRQNILHVVIKSGYFIKFVLFGETGAAANIQIIYNLFDKGNKVVRARMRKIVNQKDTYGNTVLHYAKYFPDQSVVNFLLAQGAKVKMNPQKEINVQPETLNSYLSDKCITTEGDSIDAENFRIRINFQLFEKPAKEDVSNTEQVEEKHNAWAHDFGAMKSIKFISSGKVDTKMLGHFAYVESLREFLNHPVMVAFLQLELTSLRFWCFFDFAFYLSFVITLFLSMSNKYGIFEVVNAENKDSMFYTGDYGDLSYYILLVAIFVALLIIKEIWQLAKMRLRYFRSWANFMEWCVIILVVLNSIPIKLLRFMEAHNLQRHLSALVMLIAFTRLYMLLVRVFPNTSIPIYISMFTTVMKTYFLILMSYMAFIVSFAYSFFLIFGGKDKVFDQSNSNNNTNNSNSSYESQVANDPLFANLGLSLIKTLIMFVGEMNYAELTFTHWLGYLIFALFVFLVVVVLINVLNGLAVRDIGKIQEELSAYQNISIVETLAGTLFLSMMIQEVLIYPNIKPVRETIMKMPIGKSVYEVLGGRKKFDPKNGKSYFLTESAVKSIKDLVSLNLNPVQVVAKTNLENVSEAIQDLKKELQQQKTNIETILQILKRQPAPDDLQG